MANNEKEHSHHHGPKAMQKAKNFKLSIKNLVKSMSKYYKWLIIAMILAFTGTVLNLIGPNIIGKITDSLSASLYGQIDMAKVVRYACIMIGLYAFGFIFNYIQIFIMATVTQSYTKGLRTKLSAKINKVPLSYIDNNTTGNVLSRVTNDVDTINQTMNHSVSSLVTCLTMMLGSLLMMFIKSAVLTICALLVTFIGFVVMMIVIMRSQKFFLSQQNNLGKLNGHIEEIYSGYEVVKVYNAQNEVSKEFSEINNNLYSSSWKSQFMSGIMQPIMGLIANLGNVVVFVVGVILATKGKMSFGDILAFAIYIRLFTNQLSQIAQAFTNVQSMAAAGERVFEMLDASEMENEEQKINILPEIKGQVEFKNVKFGYLKDKTIIHDFSAKIQAGQKVAIVGPTGAGKTTLVNLLMRFYEVDDGDILIDGVSTRNYTRDVVHNMFGMVLQDTWVFQGSIKDNIRYNNSNVSDDEIVEACKVCGLDNFIKALPKGYDTILDDNTSISVGQKQLLTIARAMVQHNPMLILDEATSSVDTRTEILIQNAMDNLTKGCTSFVIAHRLSTIKNADMILVLRDGDIIECGKHKELLDKNGFYADLYKSQFEQV